MIKKKYLEKRIKSLKKLGRDFTRERKKTQKWEERITTSIPILNSHIQNKYWQEKLREKININNWEII